MSCLLDHELLRALVTLYLKRKTWSWTPLHITARPGLLTVAQALLPAGASSDEPECNGTSPLSYAVVHALLAAGAGTCMECRDRSAVRYWAMEKEHADVMTVLPQAGAEVLRSVQMDV